MIQSLRWCAYGVLPLLMFAAAIPFTTAAEPPLHPLASANLSPVIFIQGLPASHDPHIAAPGDWQLGVDVSHLSNFSHRTLNNERVFFDGETTRVALSFKTGVFQGADIEVMVPVVKHHNGSLDSFIENWHDTFGLSQNGRDQWPRNLLWYVYEKNGVIQFEITEPVSGIGDTQVIMGYKLDQQWFPRQEQLVFKSSVKLPTGDADKLTGSGGFGLAAWLTGSSTTTWFHFPGLTYYHAGLMWLQEGDIMADQQRPLVAFGGIGTGARLTERIVLQLQLDTHSSLYKNSRFNEIDQLAVMFTMGGNLKISNNWNLDIAVVEDMYVHTAPDVVFQFKINGRF